MSAIDTIDHAHAGYLTIGPRDIPIYWPIAVPNSFVEYITEDDSVEEGTPITPACLFIGGGSGEHPALYVDLRQVLTKWMQEFSTASLIEYLYTGGTLPEPQQSYVDSFLLQCSANLDAVALNTGAGVFVESSWPASTVESLSVLTGGYNNKVLSGAMAVFALSELPLNYIFKDDLLFLNTVLSFKKVIFDCNGLYSVLFPREVIQVIGCFKGVLELNKFGRIWRGDTTQWGYSLADFKYENSLGRGRHLLC